MFVDNKVIKEFEGEMVYDKFAIASTMVDVSFRGATCSVYQSQVLRDCSCCNVKPLCKKINDIVEEYTEKTTVVTDSFSFGN